MNWRNCNGIVPLMWGMVLAINLVISLRNPTYLMGFFAGLSVGMLIGSFLNYQVWELVYSYHSIVDRINKSFKCLREIDRIDKPKNKAK